MSQPFRRKGLQMDGSRAILDTSRSEKLGQPPGCFATREAVVLAGTAAFFLVTPWTPAARARGLRECHHFMAPLRIDTTVVPEILPLFKTP